MSVAIEIKIAQLQRILSEHYEPENHQKCFSNVWRHFVFPQMGISKSTFNRYLKTIKDREKESKRTTFARC